MKEIVVTKPEECLFRQAVCACGLLKFEDAYCYVDDFPPHCPLFENDYLIKRRCEDATTKNAD